MLKRVEFLILVVILLQQTLKANSQTIRLKDETDLKNFVSMFIDNIETKIKSGGFINNAEFRILSFLLFEIEKRKAEAARENTVYWHLRQG